MKLIVGLGNPGEKYAGTRHNTGFQAVRALAEAHGIKSTTFKLDSLVGEGLIAGERVFLAQPCTFMNNSGKAVNSLVTHYGISEDDIIIIYDDMDLPPGKIRIKKTGSSGGHNGLKSIIDILETRKFPRIRIGIGHPLVREDVTSYVLGHFSPEEKEIMEEVLDDVITAIEVFIREGIQTAMNKFN